MFDSVWRAVYSTLSRGGVSARHSTLIYHRVLAAPDPMLPDEPCAAEFERRMRWIQRHFNVIPLAEAVTRLANGSLPARSLSVTFDDGYADNQQIAAPILSRLGLHATFFIASGYLDGGRMFNDLIIAAMRSCRRDTLDLKQLGLGTYALESTDQRRRAVSALLPHVKKLDPVSRAACAQSICEIAEVTPPDDLMMTSSQVATLADDGFEIGAHTVNHPILAQLDLNAARDEIDRGRQQLEDITHRPVSLFAYPNGRRGVDYTAQTAGLVRQLGFAAGFTTSHGVATRHADLFQLPRFTPWDRGEIKFGARMAHNMLRGNPSATDVATMPWDTLEPSTSRHVR